MDKKRSQRWLKGGYYFLNIFLPLSETGRIARGSTLPWFSLIHRVKRLYQKKSGDQKVTASLSWQDAVLASGLTPTQLEQQYRASKYRWLSIFILPTGLLAFIIMMLLFNAPSLPIMVWIKVSFFALICMAVSALGFMRALICEYRLWQLQEKRVSREERGEFQYFLKEINWIKKTLKIRN